MAQINTNKNSTPWEDEKPILLMKTPTIHLISTFIYNMALIHAFKEVLYTYKNYTLLVLKQNFNKMV